MLGVLEHCGFDEDPKVGEVRSKSSKCVLKSNSVAEAGAESAVLDE